MTTKTKGQNGIQGVQFDEKELTVAKVQEFLKKDLAAAVSCLEAIYRDPDLMAMMAEFMHGRFMNHQNKKEQDASN